ncbi:MAG TPA: SGNH/GDSL hydrolase family protein [Candidatus Saccharibacteria bacterium]|jgi:lysophospholipase L1-like esterase|nr:hypothetical protein [Patescibacteria group bacterium]HMS30943.1 SGNH/GDSL hydrolase family protein [Candidatus Saccharibacteria bacterium]
MKRYIVYVGGIFFMLATCTYLGYEAFRIYRLAGAGADMSLSTIKFERVNKGKNDILILGDSLAFGVGASTPEVSFAGKIAQKHSGLAVSNQAKIGETIVSLKNTIDSKLTARYDKIYIIVGGNDIMRIHFNIFNSAGSLDYIISKASQHADKVVLITTGRFDNVSLSPWILKDVYNARASIIRQSGLKLEDTYANYDYIDFYSTYIGRKEYKKLEAVDGYHLNDLGVDKLVSTVLESTP